MLLVLAVRLMTEMKKRLFAPCCRELPHGGWTISVWTILEPNEALEAHLESILRKPMGQFTLWRQKEQKNMFRKFVAPSFPHIHLFFEVSCAWFRVIRVCTVIPFFGTCLSLLVVCDICLILVVSIIGQEERFLAVHMPSPAVPKNTLETGNSLSLVLYTLRWANPCEFVPRWSSSCLSYTSNCYVFNYIYSRMVTS